MTSTNTTLEAPGARPRQAAYEQPELDFDQELTHTERFEKFHSENPRVYETLVGLAREWVARTGRSKLGIAALYERARWEIALATNDPEFKLNNNHKTFYARLIMLQEPDLAGLFEVRRSDEANLWAALRKHRRAA